MSNNDSDVDVKKIAEWLGFKPVLLDDDSGCVIPINGWAYPNLTYSDRLPDFPHSLDACMEHIEPVLYKKGYRYNLRKIKDGHYMTVTSRRHIGVLTDAIDDKPAMAFSRAVDKLIDWDYVRSKTE